MAKIKEKKLKFLFVSRWGEILDLAYSVLKEGNLVKMYVEVKEEREIGDGFIPKAKR